MSVLEKILKEQGMTVHPDAGLFPMMSENGARELGADIKAHGLREKITAKGKEIWDGRNRLWACSLANVKPEFQPPPKGVTAREFIVSANIFRRHLKPSQRLELIAKLVKEHPEKSNRQIAAVVKADDKTVAKVRREKEASAEIPHIKPPKARKTSNPKTKTNTNKPTLSQLAASLEISAEQRKAQNAALDAFPSQTLVSKQRDPVAEFRHATKLWFEKMNDEQKEDAVAAFDEFVKPLRQQHAQRATQH